MIHIYMYKQFDSEMQLSGKPVTGGTQRSSDELHVDETRQGDNERLNDCM